MPDVVGTGVIRIEVDEAGVDARISAIVDKANADINAKMKAGGASAGKSLGDGISSGADKGTASLKKTETELDNVKKKAESAAGKNKSEGMGLLVSVIAAVGPALVPLAGAAAALGAGLLGAAATGVLAFKGLQAEIKANTDEGLKLKTGFAGLEEQLNSLEKTSAGSFAPIVNRTITQLQALGPQLNNDVKQLSTTTADIAGHLATGIVAGFQTFEPLMAVVLNDADKLSATFERWASGPGGTKFTQALTNDFQQAVPLLENLTADVVHLLGAITPLGGATVSELTILTGVIKEIPIPVLTAATTAFVAFKTATLISGGIEATSTALNKLSISLKTTAVAEEEVNAASKGGFLSGIAGKAGGVVATLGPIAAAYAAVTIAANTASQATNSWATSTNEAQRSTYVFTTAVKDILTFNVGGLNSLISSQQKESEALSDYKQDLLAFKGVANDLYGTTNYIKIGFNYAAVATQNLSADQKALNVEMAACSTTLGEVTNESIISTAAAKSYTAAIKGTTDELTIFNQQINSTPVSQAADNYSKLQSSLEDTVNSELKSISTGGKTVGTINDIKISQDAWNNALAENAGNAAAAYGQLQGLTNVIHEQEHQVNLTAAAQQLLNQYTTDSEAKYGLTSAQVDLYSEALGINATKLTSSAGAEQAAEAELANLTDTFKNAGPALNNWLSAIDKYNKSGQTAADTASLIGSALVAANGDALSYVGALNDAVVADNKLSSDFDSQAKSAGVSISTLAKNVFDLKTGTINYRSTAAQPLIADLTSMQTQAMNTAEAIFQHAKSIGDANAADEAYSSYLANTSGALEGQAKDLGITKKQADALAKTYFGMPKDVKTQIEQAGAGSVQNLLTGILTDLDKLAGKPYDVTITANDEATALINNVHKNLVKLNGQTAYVQVQGAFVNGNGQLVGYGGRAILPQAQGGVVDYYANGGVRENHVAQIASASTTRVWAEPETGGEAYIPLSPAKRPRSTSVWQETGRPLGQAFADGGFSGNGQSQSMDDLIQAVYALAERPIIMKADAVEIARTAKTGNLTLDRLSS